MEQRRLLELEYAEEKAAFSKVAGRIGIERLAERGNAWTHIKMGKSYYNSLNQRVVELFRGEDSDVDHNFEFGRPVAFFIEEDNNPEPRFLPFAGSVSYVDGNRMVVIVPDSADLRLLSDSGSAGVILSFDETTYRLMFEALDYTMKAKGRLGELRDLIYSKRPAAEFSLPEMRFPI